jgi:hypothetical protein
VGAAICDRELTDEEWKTLAGMHGKSKEYETWRRQRDNQARPFKSKA